MERQQQRSLDAIGGEAFEGSGFESEQPATEDELILRVPADQQKGEEL